MQQVTITTKAGDLPAASLWFKLIEAGFQGVSFDKLPCANCHEMVVKAPHRNDVVAFVKNNGLNASVKKH